MTVRIYKSTDAGAPTIGRSLGSFITLLDACLVNGYGAKAAAGWTKTFVTTNKAIFKQGLGSSGKSLYVDDSVSTDYARVFGIWDATSITTMIDQFPSGGTFLYFDKPDNGWMLVANEKFFICLTYRTQWSTYAADFSFGDIVSVGGNTDKGRCMLHASNQFTQPSQAWPTYCNFPNDNVPYFAGDRGGWISNLTCTAVKWMPTSVNYAVNNHFGGGPLFVEYAMVVAASKVHQQITYRGRHPCIYAVAVLSSLADELPYKNGDIIIGTGDQAGKTFQYIVQPNVNNTIRTAYVLEISDTWSN